MNNEMKIAASAGAGAAVGAALSCALGLGIFAILLGAAVGGVLAWAIYCARDIARAAPNVYRQTCEDMRLLGESVRYMWKDHERIRRFKNSPRQLRIRGIRRASGIATGLAAGSIVSLIFATLGTFLVISLGAGLFAWATVVAAVWSVVMLFCVLIGFMGDRAGYGSFARYEWRAKIAEGIRADRRFAWNLSPIGIVYWTFVGLWRVPRALRFLRIFALRMFVAVHSDDALDCCIYAALGAVFGAIVTQSITVVFVAALIGSGLALLMRALARRIPAVWVQQN